MLPKLLFHVLWKFGKTFFKKSKKKQKIESLGKHKQNILLL